MMKRAMMVSSFFLLAITVCLAYQYQGKPIPAGPDAYTQRKYKEGKKKWRREMVVDWYNRYGSKDKKWDEKVRSFLTEMVEFFEGDRTEERIAKIRSASSELMQLGCTDPYIVYCHGNLVHQFEGAAKAEQFVRRSLEMLEKSKYPPIYRYYAANRLAYICKELQRRDEEVNALIDRKLKYFAAATADQCYKNGHQRYLMGDFYLMWDALDGYQKDTLFNYLKEVRKAEPWIATVIRGDCHIARAWKARGGDWAYKVPEKAWEGFRDELKMAQDELVKAYELHPEYPEAAADMIAVKMGMQDTVSLRQWFDRAVAAQMDYFPAYNNFLWAIRPRWYGSHEDMYAFGLECLNTKRFDTDVPHTFLKVIWDIGSELHDWKDAYRRPGVYEHLKEYYEGVLREPTWENQSAYLKSLYAVTAWAAGKYDDAKKLFDELGDKVDTSAFKKFGTKPVFVFGEVNALTGPFKDQIRWAEKLYSENQSPEGLIIFEKAYEKTKDDPMASYYLRSRIVTLRIKQGLEKEEWVDLMPKGNLAGWQVMAGDWIIAGDGTLQGTSTNEGLMLLCDTYVDGNFEIKGDVETRFQASVMLGYYETVGNNWTDFRILPQSKQCVLGRHFGSEQMMRNVPLNYRNQFLLQVWDGRIAAYINGQPVFTAQDVEEDWSSPANGRIGFAGYYVGYPGNVVKFRNVQIRRLKTKPKGFDGTSKSGD